MNEKVSILLYAFFVGAVSVLTPIIPLMLTVGMLIVVDTVFGVWSAIKRKQRITSNGLSRLAVKLFVYQTIIVTLFFFEQHIVGDLMPIMKTAATMLSVVEVISILENAGIIIEKPVFRYLIDKLSSKSNKFSEDENKNKKGSLE